MLSSNNVEWIYKKHINTISGHIYSYILSKDSSEPATILTLPLISKSYIDTVLITGDTPLLKDSNKFTVSKNYQYGGGKKDMKIIDQWPEKHSTRETKRFFYFQNGVNINIVNNNPADGMLPVRMVEKQLHYQQ